MRCFLLLLVILAPALSGADPLRVFVSVLPQETFVEKVGREHVSVEAMVRPGHSPSTYAPTPKQIAALASADLYLRIGVPFEDAWMDRIRAASPTMPVVDLRAGLDLRAVDTHGDDHHGHGGGRDPHVWTSPPLVKEMASRIRDVLADMDAAHRFDYEANFQTFARELDALDRELREILAHSGTRRFMVFHPAWAYFADTYGLTQVPIEEAGKEPGPKALVSLVEQAQRENIEVVFVQPQFSRHAADRVALAIGARVEVVDPLARDFGANLLRIARLIAGASGS
jgi:zinc transport system substrate-binding protein